VTAKEAGVLLLEFSIPAHSDQLWKMRAAVRECVEASGCSETPAADIVLAVDEACQNIIRHAYKGDPEGVIELDVRRDGDDLIICLLDLAPEVDPSKVKPRDLEDIRPGGLGTHFIQKVMDRADFLPRPGTRGNLLRMVKRIE
jgi:sigma-B regulation protein RsbU (phosphoserine phosphatase)